MRDVRWMIFVPLLLLATAAQAQNDAKKLDQMTQKLKQKCEDQGGTFVLEGASAKHDASSLARNVEGRLGERGTAGAHPNGGTAYQASGVCTNSVTLDFAHPPKP